MVSTQTCGVPATVIRQLMSQVSRGGGLGVEAQAFVAVRAVSDSQLVTGTGNHGNGLKGKLGHVGQSNTVHSEGVSNVESPVLKGQWPACSSPTWRTQPTDRY